MVKRINHLRLKEFSNWQNVKIQIYDIFLNSIIEGKKIDEYLINNGFKKIGIYGLGRLGKTVFNYFEHSNCEIEFVMDNTYARNNREYKGVVCLNCGENIPDVDMLIITAPEAEQEIKSEYCRKYNCAIKSIEDILAVL